MLHQPLLITGAKMGIINKVQGAVTFWVSPDERRAGVLPAAVLWGASNGVVGALATKFHVILVLVGSLVQHHKQ